jgi:hypothetical protein
MPMSNGARDVRRIDQFFAGPGARGDQWTNLVELAGTWTSNSGGRAAFDAALAEMTATEEFHAYPGLQLIAALRARRGQRCASHGSAGASNRARDINPVVSSKSKRVGRAR